MSILYVRDPQLAPEEIADLYRSAGLRRPVDDLDRLDRMFRHADLVIAAYEGTEGSDASRPGALVGVARALTDFSYCCYLSDLAVRHEFQRAGIGRELIRRVQQAIGGEAMLLLLAAPAAMDYYPRIGFEKVENAWQIPRAR